MNNQPAPVITIIVAVFNGARTLQQCIDSVLQQTYSNKELIIIDGGSTDGTADLLKANSAKVSYWVSETDNGIYNAWNKGLSQANGDWICFLGADDFFWDECVLNNMAKSLVRFSPKIRIAYGEVMLLSADGENIHTVGQPWGEIKHLFSKQMLIPHVGAVHHVSLFKEFGGFNESYKIAGDYEFLLKELGHSDAYFFPNLIVAGMRVGGVSTDPQQSLQQVFEVRKAQRANGFTFPSIKWILSLLRVLVRVASWSVLGEPKTRKLLDIGRKIMRKPQYWTKF